MADIRQNPIVKDNFNRADEDPLSGGGNWARPDLASPACILSGNQATRKTANAQDFSQWQPDPLLDGNAAEAWVHMKGNETSGAGWGVSLFRQCGGTNAADGYLFRIETSNVNDLYRLYRATNWVFTSIASATGAPQGSPCILLIRRNGNDVECWTDESGGSSSFALRLTVTDTNFTTGFLPGIHMTYNFSGGTVGEDDFGAGPAPVQTAHLLPILGVGA